MFNLGSGLTRKMTVALVKLGLPMNKLADHNQSHETLVPRHSVFEKYGKGFGLGWQHAHLKSTQWRCHFLRQERLWVEQVEIGKWGQWMVITSPIGQHIFFTFEKFLLLIHSLAHKMHRGYNTMKIMAHWPHGLSVWKIPEHFPK